MRAFTKMATFRKYVLGAPSKRRKDWLVPSGIREKFKNGFTKDWSETFVNLSARRKTRVTPHKLTPKREPISVESIQMAKLAVSPGPAAAAARKPRRKRSDAVF